MESPTILPRRRRIRRSQKQWCELLDRFNRGDQTQEQFCTEHNLGTEYFWSLGESDCASHHRWLLPMRCLSSWSRIHRRPQPSRGMSNCNWVVVCAYRPETPWMLSVSPERRIWLCTQATDMRRSFDGLSAWSGTTLRKTRAVATGTLLSTDGARR